MASKRHHVCLQSGLGLEDPLLRVNPEVAPVNHKKTKNPQPVLFEMDTPTELVHTATSFAKSGIRAVRWCSGCS
ncbi:MAG: hypothetical protein NTY84_09980 [Verrucomicrobia bacterium]|nr:hypothetical protein [Verrucomicrobiota bacterium]